MRVVGPDRVSKSVAPSSGAAAGKRCSPPSVIAPGESGSPWKRGASQTRNVAPVGAGRVEPGQRGRVVIYQRIVAEKKCSRPPAWPPALSRGRAPHGQICR